MTTIPPVVTFAGLIIGAGAMISAGMFSKGGFPVCRPANLTGLNMAELDETVHEISKQRLQVLKDREKLHKEYNHRSSDTKLQSANFEIPVKHSDPYLLATILNNKFPGQLTIKPDISREIKDWGRGPDGPEDYIDENHILRVTIN